MDLLSNYISYLYLDFFSSIYLSIYLSIYIYIYIHLQVEKARKLAKDKKKKELRGGGDQPHEEGGEEENEFEDDEVVEVPTIEPKASPEPKASAGYKTPTRRFRKKGSDDSLQLMRKDSSASLASDATESSPLQPKNLFGTPPEGMKQATLKRFFSPGDEKMEDFSDREPPLKKV